MPARLRGSARWCWWWMTSPPRDRPCAAWSAGWATGCRAVTAGGRRFATSKPIRREVKLLLADLDMPRMDGGRAGGARAGSRSGRAGGAHGRGRDADHRELLTGYRDLPVLTQAGRIRRAVRASARPARAAGDDAGDACETPVRSSSVGTLRDLTGRSAVPSAGRAGRERDQFGSRPLSAIRSSGVIASRLVIAAHIGFSPPRSTTSHGPRAAAPPGASRP